LPTKKLLAAGALVLSLALPATAQAVSENHAAPGTPGTKNCRGQSMAHLAQLGKGAGVEGANGVGNLARFLGMSPAELGRAVDVYCASP
jgi:hypothetical protein